MNLALLYVGVNTETNGKVPSSCEFDFGFGFGVVIFAGIYFIIHIC